MKVNHHTRKFKRERDAIRDRVKTEGGICCIPTDGCPQVFDFSLPVLDPWAFTIHHIHPTSLGGSLDHPSNMAPAHRKCNEAYGNRMPQTRWENYESDLRLT